LRHLNDKHADTPNVDFRAIIVFENSRRTTAFIEMLCSEDWRPSGILKINKEPLPIIISTFHKAGSSDVWMESDNKALDGTAEV
jgi:hypothetical protein